MYSEFVGFEVSKKLQNGKSLDFIIASDEMRLKQVMMNLQSNALKFTRSGGKIKITTTYIKSIENQLKAGNIIKSKKEFKNSFSSGSESSENSINSETRKFDEEHGLKRLMDPNQTIDKLVIQVKDTGIGIKNKDRIKLFKLFGKL